MIVQSSIAPDEIVADPVRLRRMLAGEVSRLLRGSAFSTSRYAQVTIPLGAADPLQWLHRQSGAWKVFWAGRESDEVIAAFGIAEVYEGASAERLEASLRELETALASSPAPLRYYGGVRFDSAKAPEAVWQPFGAFRFILPRFELRVTRGETSLNVNLSLPADRGRCADILAQVEALQFAGQPLGGALPVPISRKDDPGRGIWMQRVAQALAAFSATDLEKVVLARRVIFGFSEEIDPLLLLKHLQAATPGCFHFAIQPNPSAAFIGASPERLFRRTDRFLVSEAVAGTGLRGASVTADRRLRDQLLLSEKDHREHEYVRLSIQESLTPLCNVLHVDSEPSDMMLAKGRHLYSGIRGKLRDDVTDADVLQALHPTPAVGGYPTGKGVQAIRELEAFDRGWYAGAVGWIARDAAEFAVAIRSGLVCGSTLSLYSGAGIVPGSVPEAEWDEIEQKIGDFIGVLDLDP